jgi:hypothetical protein
MNPPFPAGFFMPETGLRTAAECRGLAWGCSLILGYQKSTPSPSQTSVRDIGAGRKEKARKTGHRPTRISSADESPQIHR